MGKKEKSPKPEGGLMKKLIVLSLVLLVTFVFFTPTPSGKRTTEGRKS